jgi:uncharacterized RmlC-like cupin family protein
MTEPMKWRTDGVMIVRAAAMLGKGRATAFDFAGTGGRETWIGTVTMQPSAKTGAHHHGRHEVAIYVVKGRSQIRWGEQLEYAAEVGPGDFVVVRSDNGGIVVKLDDVVPVEEPETLY